MTKMVMGKTEPRLFTPPLRKLTPKTTKGFEVITFAEGIGVDLLPWERWVFKHMLELNLDGSFRFRTILLLCSRQNGKTVIGIVLTLWLMSTRPKSMVLGTSTAQELAREPWSQVHEYAEDMGQVARVTRGSIDTSLWLRNKSRYKIAAANRRGGRSLSVDLLLVDELREHYDWDAWAALTATTTARPDPLILAMSNAGDDRSVVLNTLRSSALAGDDPSLGVFEYSAPDGAELDDVKALAQANPSLGRLITLKTLEGKRSTMPAAGFRTEHMCQRVETENPAVDKESWSAGGDPAPMSDALRKRVVLCLDVSLDAKHVSLLAGAPLDDGRVRVEVVAAWDSTQECRQALPELLARIKPRAFGWFANGPAAALGPDLRKIRGSIELTDATGICQSFAEFVAAGRLLHNEDPMLTAQVLGASRFVSGDGWRFTRKGVGYCDGAYAAAGVVHLVRSRLTSTVKPRLILPRSA